MAKKRMFDGTVILSDKFLKLPHTAMSLYFMLCITANDNGFNAAPEDLMNRTRTTTADLKLLHDNGFILAFEDGVIVIKHWLLHNYIKRDRYNDVWGGYDDQNLITVSEEGLYELIEIGGKDLSLRELIEYNNHQFVSVKVAKEIKEKHCVNPELEKPRYQNGATEESESRQEKKSKEREERTDILVINNDNLYGAKENVLLFPDEIKEIYEKFENPEDLIDKIGYIFLNSRKRYDSHYGFLMKVALEDKWSLKRKETESKYERLERDKIEEKMEEIAALAEEKGIPVKEAEDMYNEEQAKFTHEQVTKIYERMGINKEKDNDN